MSEMGWMRYVTSCDLLWPVFGAFGQKNQRNGASRGIRAIPISVNWQNQRWSRWSLWRLGSCGTGQPWKAAWYPLKLRCNISESQQDPGFVFFRGIRSIPTCRGSWSLRCKKKNHVHAVYSLVDSLPRFIASAQRATRLCSKGWYHQPISNIAR